MYHHDYYVAFDDQENVVAHSADKSTCIQQASSNNNSFNIHTATRMTDGQFLNALQQLRPDDIEFVMAVGGYFCGRLIYHCASIKKTTQWFWVAFFILAKATMTSLL